jgi:hypothetical protein
VLSSVKKLLHWLSNRTEWLSGGDFPGKVIIRILTLKENRADQMSRLQAEIQNL